MAALDPVVLFFVLGMAAGLARSELRLPPAIYEFVSLILLLAIGLKGGIQLATQPLGSLLVDSLLVILMGLLLPLLAFPLLRAGGLPRPDAASLAAHYGSVSVGTFAVALSYLLEAGLDHEPFLALFVVLLEVPAIFVGIVLARGGSGRARQ